MELPVPQCDCGCREAAVPAAGSSSLGIWPILRCLIIDCCDFGLDTRELQEHVMNALQYAGRLFSVDTLDARFTSSSTTPPSRVDHARSSPSEVPYNGSRNGRAGAEVTAKGTSPPRWRSPEFLYHGLVFLVAVPLMFKTVYDVSKSKQCSPFDTTFSLRSID